MTINLRVPDLTELKPRITVFGVGGAGGNAVNNMIAGGLRGVEFVVANTDAQALMSSSTERRIQMGTNVTEGLGAGSKPEIGAAAAEETMADIKAHLVGSHMVFITAGMGGGTGTGAAPIIARASRDEGILTVGVVTKPFQFEGARRMRAAEAGIEQLQKFVDTLLIIPNQNLFRVANEKTTFTDAFAMADDVLRAGVACITDLMVKEGLINLDFADVRAVMAGMGKAMMGTGESSGDRRAVEAAEAAISNPLLDDVCMKGASGLLVSITGGNDLTLYEVDEAASRVREEADADANIIVGATFDDELDGSIRVSVVATGIANAMPEARPAAPQDRTRLSQKLANLATLPGVPVDLDEPRVGVTEPERVQKPPVWQASGNVMIEKRQAHTKAPGAVGTSLEPKPVPQAPPRPFRPAPPSAIKRPVRRMPSMEELPLVAQKEIKAKSGEAPAIGLEAQKKKVGFLERLANVGRSFAESEELPAKREPEFDRPWGELPQAKTAERPQADGQATAPQGLRIERPRSDKPIVAGPKLVEVKTASAAAEELETADESFLDEDLEIPAFLRRRAN
jgi:cell division protein FtsZ